LWKFAELQLAFQLRVRKLASAAPQKIYKLNHFVLDVIS